MTLKPKLISSNNGLVVNNLRKSLSQKQIVRDVSLRLQRGKTIGLLGPNGAGKTTTFYMIMGLIECDGGDILLDDVHLTSLPMYKRARMGIGFLPQQPSIFRGMSVEDNLLSILETQNHAKDQKQYFPDPRSKFLRFFAPGGHAQSQKHHFSNPRLTFM